MKVWVTLDGHDAEVEFTTVGERLVLEVEGRKLDADFVRLPDGRVWSLLVDGRSYEVRVVEEEGGLRVTWQNQTVPVEARHPLEKMLSQQGAARAKTAGETILAPMPGAVVAIRVRPGEVVHAGQSVVVLEAMKMQNEIRASRPGVVARVAVEAGQAVDGGTLMILLQASEEASA